MSIEETIANAVAERLHTQLSEMRLQELKTPALLTARELAHQLRCSRSTVQRLAADGCPRVIVCDSPRYRLEEVLAWLKERTC